MPDYLEENEVIELYKYDLMYSLTVQVRKQQKAEKSLLEEPYAPIEQYTGYNQGPWTDVYALCATLYCRLTAVHRLGHWNA